MVILCCRSVYFRRGNIFGNLNGSGDSLTRHVVFVWSDKQQSEFIHRSLEKRHRISRPYITCVNYDCGLKN